MRSLRGCRKIGPTKNLKKVTVFEEADVTTFRTNFKKCSDLIETHDSSRGRDVEVPPPDEVLSDIKALSDWAASLKRRQKAVTSGWVEPSSGARPLGVVGSSGQVMVLYLGFDYYRHVKSPGTRNSLTG